MENTTIFKVLDQLISKDDFSGVVSIKKQGKIIYEKASGYADRGNRVKNNIETKFGIASGTKLFTALAIGKLIDQGKISMETKVCDIIDYNFELYSKDITIRQLLTHTSGMPDYYDEDKIDDFDNFYVDIPWYHLKEPKDYFPIFPKEEMKFLPGKSFAYCNGGFVLLAAIVAEVSKMTYKDFVEQEIFTAVGMNNSGFYAMNRLPENTAIGYVKDDMGWRTNIYNLPIVGGGDGGAFTTIGDLYILWEALLINKILSKDLVDSYIKPYVKAESEGKDTYYGHGIWVYEEKGKPVEEYIVGCDAGISFKSAIIREKEITYTVISNTGNGAWPIIREIINLVYNKGL